MAVDPLGLVGCNNVWVSGSFQSNIERNVESKIVSSFIVVADQCIKNPSVLMCW